MRTKSIIHWVLGVASALVFLGAMGMVFFYAPREATMGEIQRIFYFHVASAWVGFFGFFITFLGSIFYLVTGRRPWDILALSSTEVGLVFVSMTLLTGMLWGKPVWGVYWAWEPRLTISAVQWLIYVVYLMLRGSVGGAQGQGAQREARFAAVYGIASFFTVPLSWFAIRWWRTIHPLVLSSEGMDITPKMLHTLFASLGAFTLLYVTFLLQRMALEHDRDRLADLRWNTNTDWE